MFSYLTKETAGPSNEAMLRFYGLVKPTLELYLNRSADFKMKVVDKYESLKVPEVIAEREKIDALNKQSQRYREDGRLPKMTP